MEMKKSFSKWKQFYEKYKYVGLVLLLGCFFMLIPLDVFDKTEEIQAVDYSFPASSMEEELEKTLSMIKGAGKVKVLLTQKTGQQIIYQSDEDKTVGGENSSTRVNTVVITDAQRNQAGLVKQTNPPQFLGAMVVCDGADNASVRLAVVDAVCKLTGLGADSICVLKMK